MSAARPFEVAVESRHEGTHRGYPPSVALVLALWPGLLPAASAGNKGCFVYGTVRDWFEKNRDSASLHSHSVARSVIGAYLRPISVVGLCIASVVKLGISTIAFLAALLISLSFVSSYLFVNIPI